MQGLLIIKDPGRGYVASWQEVGAAQDCAYDVVAQNYPRIPVHDTWTLTAWWLMKDDGRPFFGPQPWPLAAFYMEEAFVEVLGEVPRCLVLFDYGKGGFVHYKFDSLEDARSFVLGVIGPYGGVAQEVEGGIVFMYTDLQGAHEVGFAINIPPQ